MFDRFYLYNYHQLKINICILILYLIVIFISVRFSKREKVINYLKNIFIIIKGSCLIGAIVGLFFTFTALGGLFTLVYILWIIIFFYFPLSLLISSLILYISSRNKHKLNVFYFSVIISMFLLSLNFYAFYYEPYNFKITPITLKSNLIKKTITILHLSDIQMDYLSKKELKLLKIIKNLNYDFMVITGDLINYKESIKDANTLLKMFPKNKPIFYVIGDTEYSVSHYYSYKNPPDITKEILQKTKIKFLYNKVEKIFVNGNKLCLTGIDCRNYSSLKIFTGKCSNNYKILLAHRPDIINDNDFKKFNLVLSGHTHGGQIRLPVVGALITLSSISRKYSAGLFKFSNTFLYINRGIGLEGFLSPKVRFFCPPEISLIKIVPD